jgi:hypothetical protein
MHGDVQLVHGHLRTLHGLQQLIVLREASIRHPLSEAVQITEHRLQLVLECTSLVAREIVALHAEKDTKRNVQLLCSFSAIVRIAPKGKRRAAKLIKSAGRGHSDHAIDLVYGVPKARLPPR